MDRTVSNNYKKPVLMKLTAANSPPTLVKSGYVLRGYALHCSVKLSKRAGHHLATGQWL